MKIFKIAIPLLLLVFYTGCTKDIEVSADIEGIEAPSNVTASITISQDNTGLVTIFPSATGASSFMVDYGDGTSDPESLPVGEQFEHIYGEGSYEVTITAVSLNGKTTSATQTVVVSFRAPENLVVNVTPSASDAFSIDVSATADFAAGFLVYFGDVDGEEPSPLMLGESITHTYPDVGFYDLRVVALSGGTETIEVTQVVEIRNPIVFPIDFESATIAYNFIDFAGAFSQIINNPDPSGENTSSKVAEFFKEEGAQVFAGTVLQLGDPVDFSEFTGFTMNSWSPLAGSTVKLKLENADDSSISVEIDAVTTVTNSWETLAFDFSELDLTQEYSKVVIFFDFGNLGAGDTFYYDNIEQANVTTGPIVSLPVTFEDDGLDYGIIGFEGADSAIEDNPVPGGINTSAKVLRTIKTVGAQFFAGTIVELGEAIDFSATSSIKIKTYSPKAGIPVRLKLETAAGGSEFVELDVNTTVIDTWEELTWDFTGMLDPTLEYVRVIVFFEFVVDLPGDGSTYYFDDIDLAL